MNLFEAVQAGDLAEIERLARSDRSVLESTNAEGISALMVAIYWGKDDVAEKLLELGHMPNLFEACALGDLDLAKALLDGQLDQIDIHSPDGFTPLQLACYFGHPDVCRELLHRGADIHSVSQNPMKLMAIHAATANGNVKISKMLLEYGAHVNAQQEGGFTPLHAAAQSGNEALIRVLHEHGADTGIFNSEGKTPLELALDNNHVGAADLLQGRIEI